MPGQAPEKRARKSQKGRGSDPSGRSTPDVGSSSAPKLTSNTTTDDTAGEEEDWAAVMQAEVCVSSKHPTKGVLAKKYTAKEERPAKKKEEDPSKGGEEKVPFAVLRVQGYCGQVLTVPLAPRRQWGRGGP